MASRMIPDPTEQLESAIERQAERQEYDPSTGKMLCAECGKPFDASELYPVSAHPAAPAVCEICFEIINVVGPYTRENVVG